MKTILFLLSLVSLLFLSTCAENKKTSIAPTESMVILAFGQSNSANHGDPTARYQALEQVLEFHEGKYITAADPMKGASGEGSSVWPRLGDLLIQQGVTKEVVFIAIGIGGTTAQQWTTQGLSGQIKLEQTLDLIQENSINVTHILFHQGESDAINKTPKSTYKKQIKILVNYLNSRQIKAPFYLSIASQGCGSDSTYLEIQEGQKELISQEENIWAGPNTDQYITSQYRFDGCHFSAQGLDQFASDWLSILK